MDQAQRESQYRSLIRNVPDTVVAVFDRELHLVLADGPALDDSAPGFLPGSTLTDIVPSEQVPEAVGCAHGALAGANTRLEYRDTTRGRTWSVDVAPYRTDSGVIEGVLWMARDVSSAKAAEEQLAHKAFHDPLTGLANRQLFMDRLQQALARLTRRRSTLAVVFVDLDRLKAVNDTLGHAAGDEVLVQAGRRIRRALRPTDTVARFGGDEFVVLCEDVEGESDAERVARRLSAVLAKPLIVDGQEFRVTASMGVTVATDPHVDPSSLVRDADAAMYRAKTRGRASFQLFEETMRLATGDRLRIETDLRRALVEDELTVMYQPQVKLGDMTTVGAEALLRWAHPERGLVAPLDFLAVAEETGLMGPIGDWVLRRVCDDLTRWPAHMRASVNLSPHELGDSELVDRTLAAVESAKITPDRLCFEISETSVFTEASRGAAAVAGLREEGFKVAIDDFGVGFSSLHHLRELPAIDVLKLDRAFVSGLGANDRDAAIVASVVLLTNSLGMEALGEGVETETQAEYLRMMGCDMAQGFLFGRPAPVEALLERVSAEHHVAG